MAHEGKALQIKKKQVEELTEKLKSAKVVAIITLKNLPDNILQKAKKKLRDKVEINIYKNAVVTRAITNSKLKTEIMNLVEKEPVAVITSNNMAPYEIYQYFVNNKGKVAAKPGQIAPFDIIVEEGETDLAPGPVLSELKMAGIDARVKAGKIVIGRKSTVAKEGDVISGAAAKALQKVNIFPFEIGVQLLGAQEGGLVFSPEVLSITSDDIFNGIKFANEQVFNVSMFSSIPTKQNAQMLVSQTFMQANYLGLNAEMYSPETIETLLSKAFGQAVSLEGFAPKTEDKPVKETKDEPEKVEADNKEDKKEVTDKTEGVKPEVKFEKKTDEKSENKTEEKK